MSWSCASFRPQEVCRYLHQASRHSGSLTAGSSRCRQSHTYTAPINGVTRADRERVPAWISFACMAPRTTLPERQMLYWDDRDGITSCFSAPVCARHAYRNTNMRRRRVRASPNCCSASEYRKCASVSPCSGRDVQDSPSTASTVTPCTITRTPSYACPVEMANTPLNAEPNLHANTS